MSEGLIEFRCVPGLKGIEGHFARGLIAILREKSQDLNFFFEGNRQVTEGAFSPNDFRRAAVTQSV